MGFGDGFFEDEGFGVGWDCRRVDVVVLVFGVGAGLLVWGLVVVIVTPILIIISICTLSTINTQKPIMSPQKILFIKIGQGSLQILKILGLLLYGVHNTTHHLSRFDSLIPQIILLVTIGIQGLIVWARNVFGLGIWVG